MNLTTSPYTVKPVLIGHLWNKGELKKSGLIIQDTCKKRLNSYGIYYDRKRNW